MPSQYQMTNVVNFSSYANESKQSKLRSVTCKMLRAESPESPPVVQKVARLHHLRPKAAGVIEKLVDDLLAEVKAV